MGKLQFDKEDKILKKYVLICKKIKQNTFSYNKLEDQSRDTEEELSHLVKERFEYKTTPILVS